MSAILLVKINNFNATCIVYSEHIYVCIATWCQVLSDQNLHYTDRTTTGRGRILAHGHADKVTVYCSLKFVVTF